MEQYIKVSAGLIEKDGKFLIAKRPASKSFGGKWEFPGGKIEPEETPEQCLVREIKEEFGIDVEVKKPIHRWEFDYHRPDGRKFLFHSFLCSVVNGEPELKEHEDMRWVEAKELAACDLLEADRELLPHIALLAA